MIGSTPSSLLPSYDETALCSNAFRVMRQMVNTWLREISINRNIYSDFQIVHFYRWLRSPNAFLYDPALRRTLNILMRKLFLQMIAEFRRLGCEIIHAEFTKIVIHTGKKTVEDAISYIDYIVKSIRNKEIFHSIHLSYQESWNILLWLDAANYAGTTGVSQNPGNLETENIDDKNDEVTLEMNWAISETLPDGHCKNSFEMFLSLYMELLNEGKKPGEALNSLAHNAFETIQKLEKISGQSKERFALKFINTVVKALSADRNLEEEVC